MAPALPANGSERLLLEADLSAERAASVVRMAIAIVLLVTVEVVLKRSNDISLLDLTEARNQARATLGLLFFAGLAVYLLVKFGRWRPWMAYVTVTVDIAVLVGSLLADLRDLRLPVAFMSMFPVVGVFPLLLAVSALRIRPWVQLYALCLTLVGLALVACMGGWGSSLAPETFLRDAEMFYSVPANTARAAMLALGGAVLVLGALRGRRLLNRAVAETTRRLNLARYLPAELLPVLSSDNIEELRTGRRAEVALVFIDIRGSTAMGEAMSPAALTGFIGAFRARVTRAARQHGGVIDKFIGDGAFIIFGLPQTNGDDAVRALAFCRSMLASVDEWNGLRKATDAVPVAVGIGVHFGTAFVGAIGDEQRLEFTVMGDAVNVAARLEDATKAFQVPLVASRDALKAAGEDPQSAGSPWRSLGTQALRGRNEAMPIYTLENSAV